MRAAQLKEDLLALRELGHDVASRILADLPPRTLQRIVQSTRVDWLPIELYLELLLAIRATSGDDGVRRWALAAVKRSIDSSLLRPLVEVAIRLFGLSPSSLFKISSQVWQQILRGCGEIVVLSHGPGACRIGLRGTPYALQHPAFYHSIGGALEAAFATCNVEGQVRLVTPSADLTAEFEATWTER